MFFSKSYAAACGFAAFSSAHMLMNTPVPFSEPALVNSPLDANGDNFPCQLTSGGSYSAGSASNTFALGSTQPLEFTGEAVHGGGSCQISLTYDTAPTSSSVWKVITSIEGGCPARDTAGNLGADDDASAADPYTYNFTVPSDIPTGSVTLAWTWFNKIGNREMYMNCAPVTLTGTSGDQSNFDALPDMFVANIDNGCGTVDSKDLLFPDPGLVVQSLNGATSAFAAPTGTCQTASSNSSSDSGSGSSDTTTTAAAAATTAAEATTAAAATTAASNPGGVFVTAATSAAASSVEAESTSAAVATAAATSVAAASVAASSAAASSSSSTSTTTGAETAGSACSPDGTWNCVDGSSYQQCASGTWSVVQSLAAGTSCTVGQSSSIDIVASSGKHRRMAVRFRG